MTVNGENTVMTHDSEVAERLQRLVRSESYIAMRQTMMSLLNIQPTAEMTIYDIGCGEGSLCRDLRKELDLRPGSQIVGMDSSPFVLAIAKEQEADNEEFPIQYLTNDVVSLPKPDDSADIVIFANTLKYMKTPENEEAAIKELMRVLRAGGRLLIVDSNDAEIQYLGLDQAVSQSIVGAYAQLQGNPYAARRIDHLCEEAGITDVEIRDVKLMEKHYTPESAGFVMAQNICSVLANYAASNPNQTLFNPNDTQEFLEGLIAAEHDGSYQWQYDKHMVTGKAPV